MELDSQLPTSESLAVIAPQKKRTRVLIGIAIVLITTLVAAGALLGCYYPPIAGPVHRSLVGIFFPKSLAGATLIVREDGKTFLYEQTPWRLNRSEVGNEYATTFISRNGTNQASVAALPNNQDVLMVNGIPVYTSSSKKTTLSLAPGASAVAFTEKISDVEQGTVTRRAVVLTVASKNRLELGEGHTPLFIDAERVLWFVRDGVLITNIRTGEVARLSGVPVAAAIPTPTLSPDGTLVAWKNADAATVSVYRISGSSFETLSTYALASNSATFALSNDSLYVLMPAKGTTEVWSHSLSGSVAKKLFTFWPGVVVTELIP